MLGIGKVRMSYSVSSIGRGYKAMLLLNTFAKRMAILIYTLMDFESHSILWNATRVYSISALRILLKTSAT